MPDVETEQQRVFRLTQRALLALAAGNAVLDAREAGCHCFYSDGRARFVDPDRKPVHRCGRL